MVQFGSGAGSEILRRHFQEFEDREDRVMAKRPHKKPVAAGSVMTVEFTLDRVEFVALNPESFRSSSNLPKRSRSRSTARPRMRSIISGRNFLPTADRRDQHARRDCSPQYLNT